MTSTLGSEPLASVLDTLLRTEKEHDEAAFAAAGADSSANFTEKLTATEWSERFKDVYMSVSQEGGELLYLLARAMRASTVVEFGTSFGISTLYLAAAVRDNGGGVVIATEMQADKARSAQESFAAAGVADIIDLRVGDARETLRDVPAPVDLVLLDAWPQLRVPILRLLQPSLRPGALVLVDDIDMDFGPGVQDDFLAYAADPAHGFLSLRLPVADGMQACLKL